ncbi:Aldehyde/histidinol dehydrogenase [Cantharellus anzutake]|uniref:Aldehyde/histidinol dehydrogenase n=1 Tax=Cantharellus anzutake TaxID=1750568 RepID=UPI00190825A6|nr:Aldehyde/histidinol dehydrogenase [Cantharellus anzutake]KAF8340576.1 Aldehyde/histidinol dehydrogenase [Cantharellus anzutake]
MGRSLFNLTEPLGIYSVVRRYTTARNRAVPFRWSAPAASYMDYEAPIIESPSLSSHLQNPLLAPPEPVEGYNYITCYDPATGLHLDTLPADSPTDIAAKIGLAKDAREDWSHSSWGDRRRVLRSLLAWLVKDQEVCARVACRDTGKTMIDASLGEILTTCSKLEWLINYGEIALRPERRRGNLILSHKTSTVHYEPLGVVAAIVSWNYPLHNALSPIISAIFSGNAIVLKCSEHTMWSSRWFVGAVRECIYACGWNPDIVQLVCCLPDDSEVLTTSPDIKHITFIGSETVGRKVAMAATVNLTPVTLELGGKDPCIILPRTNIQKWSSVWMRGAFQSMGQNCIGIERFLVHSSLYEEFMTEMADRVSKLRLGSVLSSSAEGFVSVVDGGSMINNARFDELERLMTDAESLGADVRCGGTRWRNPYSEQGAYFRPTLIGNVNEQMEIARTEVFGPVMLVLKYDSVDEAVGIANGLHYGLGASVFGPDQGPCKEVAMSLECGMVSINDFAVYYVNLPFGGTKGSGYGRFGGPEGLRALTNPKVVVVDRFPVLAETSIPVVVHSWDFVSGLISALYGQSWKARMVGLTKLIKAATS